jgi:hypothetical protein
VKRVESFWLSLADHWCLGSGSTFCVLSPDGQEVLCWLFSEGVCILACVLANDFVDVSCLA